MKRKMMLLVIINVVLGLMIFPNINANNISKEQMDPTIETNNYDSWPMFKNNAEKCSFSKSQMPDECSVKWINKDFDPMNDASPVVYEGKLYTSNDWGVLFCVDALNGNVIWETETGIDNFIDMESPAVANDKVYIGVSHYVEKWVRTGFLYCYDASTGIELWKYETSEAIDISPIVADNYVYFGCDDCKIYCLDSNNGAFIWDYDIDDIITSSSPALSRGKLYVGSNNDLLHCLDAYSGDLLWSYNTSEGAVLTPAIYKDKVYFSTYSGAVFCLDAETGFEIWSHSIDMATHSSPAVAYDKVYLGCWSDEGLFFCLDANSGDELWRYQLEEGWHRYEYLDGSAAVADGKVYFGGSGSGHSMYPAGYAYCLDAGTGVEIWKYQVGVHFESSMSGIHGTPAIANGMVYFTVDQDEWGIYAFGEYTESSSKPTITGPNSGEEDTEYTYTFTYMDPDNYEVYYWIEWGEGTVEQDGWIGPYESGEEVILNHEWDESGTYTIRAKAKNILDEESDWGELRVSMPRSKNQNILHILKEVIERMLWDLNILKP